MEFYIAEKGIRGIKLIEVEFPHQPALLCELVFRTMTPREMIKLLKLATWENAEAGECFVERDQPLDRLMVIW